jgi:hypothetical protein
MGDDDHEIILREQNNTLIVSEKRGGAIVTIMRVTAGAITIAQLAYYEANLRGRVKQIEADLILKYFYGIE